MLSGRRKFRPSLGISASIQFVNLDFKVSHRGIHVKRLARGRLPTDLDGATPIPANGNCTVTANVTAAAGGSFLNTLVAGALQTDQGNNSAPAIATLTVVPAPVAATSVTTLNEWGAMFFMVLAGLGSIYYLTKYRRV